MQRADDEEDKTDRHATPSRRQLSWFLFFRILVITLFLSGTIFYQLQSLSERPAPVLPDLYLLVALSYLQFLLSAVVLRSGRWLTFFAQVQVAWDLLFCSALIYITGGVESPFSFLYILIILSAGFFLTRKGPFMAASAAAIFYGSLLDLQYYGYLPPFGHELISPPDRPPGCLFRSLHQRHRLFSHGVSGYHPRRAASKERKGPRNKWPSITGNWRSSTARFWPTSAAA